MSNENIALIVGFGIETFIIVVFAIGIIRLLLKRRPANYNNIVYGGQKMKDLITKYCATDAINTKRILERHHKFENNEEYIKIVRPKRFTLDFERRTFLSDLGDIGIHLFGIETLYKASPNTTDSIIEYIDTVKQFVRSTKFTSLTTDAKQYVAVRIEEQLCKMIFKYIDGAGDKLYEGDEAIILDAIGLEHLIMPTDM